MAGAGYLAKALSDLPAACAPTRRYGYGALSFEHTSRQRKAYNMGVHLSSGIRKFLLQAQHLRRLARLVGLLPELDEELLLHHRLLALCQEPARARCRQGGIRQGGEGE
jgi:hypothetical protein